MKERMPMRRYDAHPSGLTRGAMAGAAELAEWCEGALYGYVLTRAETKGASLVLGILRKTAALAAQKETT